MTKEQLAKIDYEKKLSKAAIRFFDECDDYAKWYLFQDCETYAEIDEKAIKLWPEFFKYEPCPLDNRQMLERPEVDTRLLIKKLYNVTQIIDSRIKATDNPYLKQGLLEARAAFKQEFGVSW